jgi:hypothetical protein
LRPPCIESRGRKSGELRPPSLDLLLRSELRPPSIDLLLRSGRGELRPVQHVRHPAFPPLHLTACTGMRLLIAEIEGTKMSPAPTALDTGMPMQVKHISAEHADTHSDSEGPERTPKGFPSLDRRDAEMGSSISHGCAFGVDVVLHARTHRERYFHVHHRARSDVS